MELVVSSSEKIIQDKSSSRPIPLDHSCSVCGAPASAHHHYGAVVCYPCRAFFRRGTTKNFQCRTGKFSCPLEQSVKNRCRGCRYKKCLQVGMKPEMVDATLLKKNPNGLKKKLKKQTHELLIDGDNAPLDLSRANNSTSDDESPDPTTRVYYIYNPPTQTYEPVTIISLGDEVQPAAPNPAAAEVDSSMDLTAAALHPAGIVNNIHTDHEEIVQTCDQTTIAGEVIVCDTFDSEVEREEIVDAVKEEVITE